MKTTTTDEILAYIKGKGPVTPRELYDHFSISSRAIFKQLKKLIEKGVLEKIGTPPKVYYQLVVNIANEADLNISKSTQELIDSEFLEITPMGEIMSGTKGFQYWCKKRNLDPSMAAVDFVNTFKKYGAYRKNQLIDGMYKMRDTFKDVFPDQVFYLDFYSIERFGKTKLGKMLLYAKQSQNKEFIRILVNDVKPKIEMLIKLYKIDAVCFVPPTVKREVQFMNELKRHLSLNLPTISIYKVKTQVVVPQKTLNKLEDRIENASRTIIVDDKKSFRNILLIDDAVGSGASMNETARQLKNKGVAIKKVIAVAITGSFKGFDVISEV